MKRVTGAAIKTATLLAIGLSLALALFVPIGYLIMSYERQSAVLETEAEGAASDVSQLISANPEYWRYEMPRLESFLSHRPLAGHPEIRRIVGAGDAVLAESRNPVERPFITRSHPL